MTHPIKITHLGAKDCVTGSCHLVQTNPEARDNVNILVDCGKALLVPMLHDAMSFSKRNDKEIQRMEKIIDELSWGFELDETFSLKKKITFKLRNAGIIKSF